VEAQDEFPQEDVETIKEEAALHRGLDDEQA
jgi:hypothetical protein